MSALRRRRPSTGRTAPSLNRRQDGQAIVEFIVAAMFFLIPLYLIIMALGKFSDVQAGASQAARYAAWERTVWLDDASWRSRMGTGSNQKTTAEIRSEIAQRVVGDTRLTIAANDKSRNNLSNGQLQMWRDGQGRDLLERYQDLTLTESGQALTVAQCPTCATPVALNVASLTVGINVPQNNMVVANAGIQVARNSAALQRLFPSYTGFNGLLLSDRVALLPNEWMANGRDGVTTVVKDAVPTATPAIKGLMTAAVAPMIPFAWEIIPLKIGDIRPDEVPADRLR